MIYLSRKEILRLNERTVFVHGGNYLPPENLLHPEPLDYLVEIVSSELFGQPAYPEIWHKAGLYMFNIISNHIFSDGNKRTGLGAALYFLRLNDYILKDKLTSSELPIDNSLDRLAHLEAFTILVASGQTTLTQVQDWFKENIEHSR